MRHVPSIIAFAGVLALSSCSKSTAPGTAPQATVVLRDGTSFAGSVVKASSVEISVQAPNGETRTYPMSQVDSVQYAQPQTVASSPVPAPVSSAPAQQAPLASNSAPAPANPAPVREMAPERPAAAVRVVPAGTTVEVRNNELIDSKAADVGQTFSAVIARDVADRDGRVVIPRGSEATLIVRGAEGQGKLQGRSELALDIDSVRVNGRRYRVETADLVEKGREGVGLNKRTGVFTGGGAALGTLIGAIAGGGKGAGIGALAGAGAGTATQAITRGKGVHVNPETIMTFRLEAPLRITEMR